MLPRPFRSVCVPAAAVVACVGSLCALALFDPTPAGAGVVTPAAYVVNDDGSLLTPIATATNTAGTPIPVGVAPSALAITPDGQTAYVTSEPGTVFPVDLATGTVGAPIVVGPTPDAVAITPDGRTAYVVDAGATTVTPIDLSTDAAGTPITVGQYPQRIAIAPDGQTAYVSNGVAPCPTAGCGPDSTVTPVDLATGAAGTPIPVGARPGPIAVTPDGRTVYVVDETSDTVSVITTAAATLVGSIPVGSVPDDDDTSISVTSTGRSVYVGGSAFNVATDRENETVTKIATSSDTVVATLTIATTNSEVVGLAVTPDDRTAYAVAYTGPVVAITLTAFSPEATVATKYVTNDAVAVTPDPAPTASFTVTPGAAGTATSFDGSASTSPVGSVVAYTWAFGDGTHQATTSPTTTHVYANPGTYDATLTVTNSQGTSVVVTFTGQTVSNDGGPSATTAQSVAIAGAPCPAPQITSAAAATARAGTAFTFEVTTCSVSVPVIKAATLPNGLSSTDNGDGTATVSGTPGPKDAGAYDVAVTAKVAHQPTASQTLVITVDNPGVFTSKDHYTDTTGGPFTFAVTTAYAYPTPSITVSGHLPPGVTFVDNGNGTATVSASGAVPGGVYQFVLVSTNGLGDPVDQVFTLTVDQLVQLAPLYTVTVVTLTPIGPIPVVATGYPAPTVRVSGLPKGLTYSDGEISGTALYKEGSEAGVTYLVTVTAKNRFGSSSETFSMKVVNRPVT